MDPAERAELILFCVCIVLNAMCSAAETALISIRRSRVNALADEGRAAARLVDRVLDHPERTLASIQAAITGLTVAGTVAATLLFLRWYGVSDLARVLLAGFVAYLLFLLLGELVPKTVARRHSEGVTLFLIRPVTWMTAIVFPLIQVLIFFANILLRLMPGQKPFARNPYVTEEEIKVLVEKGEEMGDLEEDEREMVTAIFDLDRRVVREVMVPRVDVISVDAAMPLDDVIDVIITSGHTRVPVCEGNLDNISGVILAKDLLRYLRHGRETFTLQAVMRPATFVPENKNAKVLLEEMRAHRIPFAVVVDEYGGTGGIVTLEDLIEEIIGEIRDEYDVEEDPIARLGENAALVDGRTPIEEVNDEMDIEIPMEEYDSIGGFVVGLFGHVPAVGDEAKWENVRFVVDAVSPNRVRRVRILVDRDNEAAAKA